jgi:hypothetical protein
VVSSAGEGFSNGQTGLRLSNAPAVSSLSNGGNGGSNRGNGVERMGDLERGVGYDHSPLSRIRPFLDIKQEIALQGLLVHLKGLLNAAANEPRLKVSPAVVPFPLHLFLGLLPDNLSSPLFILYIVM